MSEQVPIPMEVSSSQLQGKEEGESETSHDAVPSSASQPKEQISSDNKVSHDVPMDVSSNQPQKQGKGVSEARHNDSSTISDAEQERRKLEAEKQMEAANTLVLLQQVASNALRAPQQKKKRKSGSPRKRAAFSQATEDDLPHLGTATEESLEVEPSAFTDSGLIRVSKDPTPISNFGKRSSKSLKQYYESLMREETTPSQPIIEITTNAETESEQPLLVTQFFQTTLDEDIPSISPPRHVKGTSKIKPKASPKVQSKAAPKSRLKSIQKSQSKKVPATQTTCAAAPVLQSQPIPQIPSSRTQAQPVPQVQSQPTTSVKTQVVQSQPAPTILTQPVPGTIVFPQEQTLEIHKLIHGNMGEMRRLAIEMLKRVNQNQASKSLLKAAKTKLKVADIMRVNDVLFQTIRAQAPSLKPTPDTPTEASVSEIGGEGESSRTGGGQPLTANREQAMNTAESTAMRASHVHTSITAGNGKTLTTQPAIISCINKEPATATCTSKGPTEPVGGQPTTSRARAIPKVLPSVTEKIRKLVRARFSDLINQGVVSDTGNTSSTQNSDTIITAGESVPTEILPPEVSCASSESNTTPKSKKGDDVPKIGGGVVKRNRKPRNKSVKVKTSDASNLPPASLDSNANQPPQPVKEKRQKKKLISGQRDVIKPPICASSVKDHHKPVVVKKHVNPHVPVAEGGEPLPVVTRRSLRRKDKTKPSASLDMTESKKVLQRALNMIRKEAKIHVSFTIPSTVSYPYQQCVQPAAIIASSGEASTSTTSSLQVPIASTSEPIPVTTTGLSEGQTPKEAAPASTDLKSILSSLETIPKGLNLPVLEFLKNNFPTLRLETLGDIMQVNNLLTKTLQMQEKQQQERVKAKELASSKPKVRAKRKKYYKKKVFPPPNSVVTPLLRQPSPPISSGSGSAVLVQVIETQTSAGSPTQSPPTTSKATPNTSLTLVSTIPAPITTPVPSVHPVTKAIEEKMAQTSKAKSQAVQHAKTLVDQAENEAMEVDVVGVPERMELPLHLLDHTYSLYNPVNGERMLKPKIGPYKSNNIPPARVSFAPQLPDSPTLLYKLLKIQPRKPRSSAKNKVDKTPVIKAKQGRFTPSGGSHARRGGVKSVKSGRGSKGESQTQSDEGSASSGSEQSDNEGSNEMVVRRRSQRFAGQRKRYVDDINVSLSDEEAQELVVLTPKARKGNHGDEDDGEYGEEGEVTGKTKVKTKATPINPTEGFQYSDIYFEPPAEEAEIVERILAHRTREAVGEEEKEQHGEKVEEFFVKYKSYSYLHAKWATFTKLLSGDKRFEGKVKRYRAKRAALGVFAEMDEEPFNPEYTVVDRVLDKATQEEPGGEVVTHFLVKWRLLPYEDATWELMEDVDKEAIRLYDIRTTPPENAHCTFVSRPPPSAFKPIKTGEYRDGNKLRSYQLEGVNWLLFNWYTRQNCILADEMGLGKTVQSIALLQEIHNTGVKGPFLVIAPLSTIGNWQREAESWTDFNVIVYHGSAYSRRLIHEYELYHRDNSGKVIPNTYKFTLIITTYEVILSDDSELRYIQWRVVIIDEAHRLKNRNCKLLEELKAIEMEHRVLLTGTPLQNSVEELFSLLNFLEPSTFTSHHTFLQQFGDLKTEQQVDELKMILKPMMLRRLKEDVEKSLAPKEETIVEVELTVIQKQYYRAILEKNFTFLAKPGGGGAMPSLLNVMMELRKCCNHPFLIQGAEQHIVTDYQRRYPENSPNECLVQASGKLVLISKLLPKLRDNGHKVLIFSQMVRCLDMLEDFLRMKGYLYERIDGNVRGTLRQAAIDRFSKPNSDRFVFLLCTRAGGLGINLTAADTVIIYDSDWNPQNDLQAQARCHRIGQNKAVKVYRLITRNTYERDMFDRASLKLGLDKAVLHSSGSASSGSGAPQLSKKEVEDLLKKGAYGALLDEDDDANKFCEEDIDQILERRTQVIQVESEGKGSTFAKASFSADGSSDLSIDDPNFWQRWAEKAKLDLDELANKDTLVIDTPRQRRQVRRYGNDDQEEVVDMGEIIDEVVDPVPSRGKQGWTKLECLKVEKGLLTYGWAEWRRILTNTNFTKRQLMIKDLENIARSILVYCLTHFTGDEKVTVYVNRLIDPTITTETKTVEHRFHQPFTPEELQELRAKDPETLFEDTTYMKHLKRHSNKVLLRVRQLHVLRWGMLVELYDQIMAGTNIKDLDIELPQPEEGPPASWWTIECDYSLLVGIVKHGYEMFGLMRADRALSFRALCGEEPKASSKKKKAAIVRAAALAARSRAARGEDSESGDESEWEEGLVEPPPGKVIPKVAKYGVGGFHSWPILADVNTRARRYVTTWLRHQRREEIKQQNIQREHVKKEKEAEHQRKREQRKAELAQKWSKREEQDFARVVACYGVKFSSKMNKYDWSHFRFLASLTKKSDERLTLYFHDFKRMCWRVLKKKPISSKKGLSGIAVETIAEDRASRCLQRINLMTAVREEIIPHPEFQNLIKLCELSFEVPSWWLPVLHDTDLIKGVAEHGLQHSEDLIYNDSKLRFKSTVPQSALYDPNMGIEKEESSSEEDEDQPRHRDSQVSNSVPLGWPKEKAIVIRLSRIVYAFRHRTWPRPMEGLDLFTPSVDDQFSSSESQSEATSDEEWGRANASMTERDGQSDMEEEEVDVGEPRDFEIERSQGLKLTLKKAPRTRSSTRISSATDSTKLMIKIPLVQLTFASSSGLKRIPKKRTLEQANLRESSPSDAKRQRTATPQAKNAVIVDPREVDITDLKGHERVGVINRNTGEKLPLNQSPTLKNLSFWLNGHPHFNVESDWGPLAMEWGALKEDMQHRVLKPTASREHEGQQES